MLNANVETHNVFQCTGAQMLENIICSNVSNSKLGDCMCAYDFVVFSILVERERG